MRFLALCLHTPTAYELNEPYDHELLHEPNDRTRLSQCASSKRNPMTALPFIETLSLPLRNRTSHSR